MILSKEQALLIGTIARHQAEEHTRFQRGAGCVQVSPVNERGGDEAVRISYVRRKDHVRVFARITKGGAVLPWRRPR